MNRNDLLSAFKKNAGAVSMVVVTIASFEEAFEYALDLCENKQACRLLASGCEAPLSASAVELCQEKSGKVIAAPALVRSRWEEFDARCHRRGVKLISRRLRDHLAGIDIGFTVADFGIAETGTLVLDCANEDLRLATMISEIHLAVLPLSRLAGNAAELTGELSRRMARTPGYIAFITGASRTADIERVLALGVHGPLEVHVLLWEDS